MKFALDAFLALTSGTAVGIILTLLWLSSGLPFLLLLPLLLLFVIPITLYAFLPR